MPGAAFACRKRCTRPSRLTKVPSSSATCGDRQHQRGALRSGLGIGGAEHDHAAGPATAARLGAGRARRRARARARRPAAARRAPRPSPRESPSIAAPARVGRALGAQRQVRHAGQRRLRAHAAPGRRRRPPCRSTSCRSSPSASHGGAGGGEHHDAPRASPDQLPRRRASAASQSVAPAPSAVADQRRLDPVAAVHPAIVQPAVVAHEVRLTSRLGRGRRRTTMLSRVSSVMLQPCEQPGQTDAVLVEVPGARLVQEVLREQRAHRAEVDDVARPRVVELLRLGRCRCRRGRRARYTLSTGSSRHVVHEAHAARAEDAAVRRRTGRRRRSPPPD